MDLPTVTPLVSSPTCRQAVKLARTIDLFLRKKETPRVYRSLDPLEWVEASTMVAAKLRVRSRLRVLSRPRCESTRSLAASVLEATLRQLHCEPARAYLNLRVRLHRSLIHARARSHWNFAHAHSENGAVFTASILEATLWEWSSTASMFECIWTFRFPCTEVQICSSTLAVKFCAC